MFSSQDVSIHNHEQILLRFFSVLVTNLNLKNLQIHQLSLHLKQLRSSASNLQLLLSQVPQWVSYWSIDSQSQKAMMKNQMLRIYYTVNCCFSLTVSTQRAEEWHV